MELLSRAEANRRIWGTRHPRRARHPVPLLTLLFGLVLWLAACRPTLPIGPTPPGATFPAMSAVLYITRYHPVGPDYARWYRAVERCAMMKGDFASIRWYLTPAPWSDGKHEGLTFGMSWDGRILLNLPEAGDSALVSHEMLHNVLAFNHVFTGSPHPSPWFGPHGCAQSFHVGRASP